MSAEGVVNVRLLDVNDNVPKLVENKAFICAKNAEPVIIKATDRDKPPFAQPFTFVLGTGQKSPNWDLTSVDGTRVKKAKKNQKKKKSQDQMEIILFCLTGLTAKLTLKKIPTSDQTFTLPINIKDNAGLGVTNALSGK